MALWSCSESLSNQTFWMLPTPLELKSHPGTLENDGNSRMKSSVNAVHDIQLTLYLPVSPSCGEETYTLLRTWAIASLHEYH